MKVIELKIANCKSYREPVVVSLDRPTSVLVGPNGGGKSNTLDILTVLLRKHFRGPHELTWGEDSGVLFKAIHYPNQFSPSTDFFDRNIGGPDAPSEVVVTLEVGESDVQNLAALRQNYDAIDGERRKFRHGADRFPKLDEWALDELTAGSRFTYEIQDGDLVHPEDATARGFQQLMWHLPLFETLAIDLDGFEVKPPFVFYPPYRSAVPGDTRVSLAETGFLNLLQGFNGATSRTQTGAIKLATAFFAEKRRELEERGGDIDLAWLADPDVQLVGRFLRPLGYSWHLNLIDRNRNTYEVVLSRPEGEIDLGRASSGEKEMINFLLGIAALRTRGGLIVVDEPELHLHPRWQGVVRDLLFGLAEETGNQVILSTHSPVFVTPSTLPSVVRVHRKGAGGSAATSLGDEDLGEPRAVVEMINTLNNERLFFSDFVLLVEGLKDRIVFDALLTFLAQIEESSPARAVVDVGGKGYFNNYVALLDGLGIRWRIIADLDYGVDKRRDALEGMLEERLDKAEKDVLKNKKSWDRLELATALEEGIREGNLDRAEQVWSYIKSRYRRIRLDLSKREEETLQEELKGLAEEGILIMSGELEDALPGDFRSVSRVLELVGPDHMGGWVAKMATGEADDELLTLAEKTIGMQREDTLWYLNGG